MAVVGDVILGRWAHPPVSSPARQSVEGTRSDRGAFIGDDGAGKEETDDNYGYNK